MVNQFSRTELLLGVEAIKKLKASRVIVFGVGGVGGYVVESLVRSGVGAIDVVDNDVVSLTNINRQIIATHKTVGLSKVQVIKERMLEINPEVRVNAIQKFYTPQASNEFDFTQYDYIVDAIDTVVGKISLIEKSKEYNIPIICAMGAGNKLNPSSFEVADISKTSVCPLARVIRTELKKRKISKVKVVYSKEPPIKPSKEMIEKYRNDENIDEKVTKLPASSAFCPSVMGLIMASEVVKDLT